MLELYASSPSGIHGMVSLEEYKATDFGDSSSFHHLDHLPSLEQQQQQEHEKMERDQSPPSTTITGDPKIIKKLSHNASERDRRKKINCLYSSLRSLLPASDQMVLFNFLFLCSIIGLVVIN